MKDSLDLRMIFQILMNKLIWIISATLVGFILLYVYASYFVTPMYTSQISFLVKNTTEIKEEVGSTEINTSRQLVSTYIAVLQNDNVFLQEVAAELDISVSRLRESLTMTTVNETQVLQVKAETADPVLSARICNVMARKAPLAVDKVGGAMSSFGMAEESKVPSSPNIAKYAVIGALLGMVLSCVIFVLLAMLDNTVKGATEVEAVLGVPVLGEIPDIDEAGREKGAKYGK